MRPNSGTSCAVAGRNVIAILSPFVQGSRAFKYINSPVNGLVVRTRQMIPVHPFSSPQRRRGSRGGGAYGAGCPGCPLFAGVTLRRAGTKCQTRTSDRLSAREILWKACAELVVGSRLLMWSLSARTHDGRRCLVPGEMFSGPVGMRLEDPGGRRVDRRPCARHPVAHE